MKFFLVLVFFITVAGAFSQNDSSFVPKRFHKADYSRCGHNAILTIAIMRNNFTSYEMSLGRGYSAEYSSFPLTFSQYGAGIEMLVDKNNTYIAPKLSCELSLFPIPFPMCFSRLNLLYYIDPKGAGSYKYRHEVGLSYMGYVNINYSYTFSLSNRSFLKSGHGINFQLNIPLGKRKFDRIS